MNKFVFIICLFFFRSTTFSQEINAIIQQRIEFWMEKNQLENSDLSQLQEILEYFFKHPININSVKKETLISLDLLNEIQIDELILHREKFGDYLTIYELQTLSSWNMEIIEQLSPFLSVEERGESLPITGESLRKNGKIEGLTRFVRPLSNHKVDSSFVGNSDYYLARFRYNYFQRINVGITAEKDAGELFFKGVNKYGFDFYSAYVSIKGGKYIHKAILGDYHIQIGQGLNVWTNYSFGKSLDILTIKKNAQSLQSHTSTNETRFLRGAAIELNVKRLNFLIFGSYNQKDGSYMNDSINAISSLLTSGYHRTLSEIQRKDRVMETMIGCYLKYNYQRFHVGAATVSTSFTPMYVKSINSYNKFDFRGNSLYSSSIDYSYNFHNFLLFGEFSTNDFNTKNACLNGLLIALDDKVSMSFLYRNYNKEYETIYNAGFSEGNTVQNESGLFSGVQLKPSSRWNIQAYSDFFKFPWLKYQVNLPSKGYENVIQVSYKPSKKTECYFRFRTQSKEFNEVNALNNMKGLIVVSQQNARVNFNYQFNETMQIRSRIELIRFERKDKPLETGSLFYQEVSYKPSTNKMEYTFRYILFDTDSYASRIYGYESTATYQYACPAYYGKGNKAYILVKYSFLSKFDCWFRISTSEFTVKNINEINLQFRWRL